MYVSLCISLLRALTFLRTVYVPLPFFGLRVLTFLWFTCPYLSTYRYFYVLTFLRFTCPYLYLVTCPYLSSVYVPLPFFGLRALTFLRTATFTSLPFFGLRALTFIRFTCPYLSSVYVPLPFFDVYVTLPLYLPLLLRALTFQRPVTVPAPLTFLRPVTSTAPLTFLRPSTLPPPLTFLRPVRKIIISFGYAGRRPGIDTLR